MPSVKKHVVPPGLMNTKIVSMFPTFIFIFLLHYLDVEGKFVTGVQLTVFTAAGVLFVVTADDAAAIEAQSVHKTRLWGRLHSPCRPLLCPVRRGAGGDVVVDQRLPL